jgi:transcriptional regulator with XRE-family HTH domain
MTQRGAKFNQIVGRRLLEAMKQRGRSSRSVALAIGIDPTSLMNYTRKSIRAIPVPVVIDVCEEIGVSPYDLVIQAYYELGPKDQEPEEAAK